MNAGWRRAPAVWFWLAALALCAVVVARSKFTADLSAFLPKAPTAQQQLLIDQLRDGVASRLILVAIDGADAPARAALSKALAARLRSDARFSLVRNGEPAALERDQAFLFQHRYLLSPAVTPEHFSVAGLHQAIADTIDLLASPAGLIVKSILPSDPTGEMPLLLGQLADSAGASGQPRSIDGAWASRDGRRALLLVQTRAPGSDTDGQQQAMAALRSAFAAAKQQAPASAQAATLVMSGPGVFGVEARDSMARGGAPVADRPHADRRAAAARLSLRAHALARAAAGAVGCAGWHRRGQPGLRHRARHHARFRHDADRRGGRLFDLPVRAIGSRERGRRGPRRLGAPLLADGAPRRADLGLRLRVAAAVGVSGAGAARAVRDHRAACRGRGHPLRAARVAGADVPGARPERAGNNAGARGAARGPAALGRRRVAAGQRRGARTASRQAVEPGARRAQPGAGRRDGAGRAAARRHGRARRALPRGRDRDRK